MTPKPAVGLLTLQVEDPEQGVTIPVAVCYPAQGRERRERVGPYELSVARDAAPTGDNLPLVVISHGNTGSPWTHRGLATHLARSGYATILPEHLGNSHSDPSLTGTAANLANRPRHVRIAIDAVLRHPHLGPRTVPVRVGVIGHSIGAYTALAVAGGRPTALPHEVIDGGPLAIEVMPDPRIRALVLLAPACPWFMADGSLTDVRVPVMLRTGEQDLVTPPTHARIIERGLPPGALVDSRTMAGAGHFSFQDPFPPTMRRLEFPPSQDPPGFDRAVYQRTLRHEISTFLDDHLHE